MKECSRCRKQKPLSEFSMDRSKQDGLMIYCKECNRAANKKSYEKHRKKRLEKMRRRRAENPLIRRVDKINGRARKRGLPGRISVKDYVSILEEYGQRCLKCGSENNIVLDHIVPLGEGGSNTVDNLQPLCYQCNHEKGVEIVDYRNWRTPGLYKRPNKCI